MSSIDMCLRWDPWEGDMDADYVLLSDKMVVAAKRHLHCHVCDGPIEKGERHRARREVFEKQALTFRFCALCCEAAAHRDQNFDALDKRYALHPHFKKMREQ